MRLRLLLPLLLICSNLSWAREASDPPGLEPIPDGSPEMDAQGAPVPEVRIRRLGARGSIEEYRAGGVLYMIKVVPTKGIPYYLVDTDGDGYLEARYNDLQEGMLIPAWVLLRW
ncbi:MAG: DUF2782 domain-containing protein [Candidatus Competibacteraceae bacterium]|nr:DUF2782 domain-containing protein [Candidatus Competibacteraceae bacterium]